MKFNWWKLKQEKKMAKKTIVTFTQGEAPKPKRLASGMIALRSPVPFLVPAGKSKDIDLGIAADVILLTSTGTVFAPNQNIVVTVVNKTDVAEKYEAGDTIGRALPIIPVEYDIA